jgi:hypothetical protein
MTQRNHYTYNKWYSYYFTLDRVALIILNEKCLSLALKSLWNNLQETFDSNTLISIQFKVRYEIGVYRSLSYIQTVKLNEYEELLELFIEFLNLKDEEYISLKPNSIVFTFQLLSPDNGIITSSKINRRKSQQSSNIQTFNFKGWNLPNTMDYSEWGEIISESENLILVKKRNSNAIYNITLDSVGKQAPKVRIRVKLLLLRSPNRILLEFTDEILNNGNLNSFIRTIKNQEYIFVDGNCILKKIKKECKFLTKIQAQAFISQKYVTMDLETRINVLDNTMIPYALSIFDGKESISFYISDYTNSDDMLKNAIKYLMKPKFHNYKVYIHNFSFFDGIFLLRILSEMTDITIKPIFRDGRIIELKFPFLTSPNNKVNLYFRDSLLLLPSSLKDLAINFNVTNKGIYPYSFVNQDLINFNYIGDIPNYEYFDTNKVSLQEYQEYSKEFLNKPWSLKIETIKYCNLDCIVLYNIISNFQKKIYTLFRIDVTKYPTLSSLAFAIYRNKFLANYKIPLIEGKLFDEIKKGYTGGSVDVYKPRPEKEEKVYRYDVNSLYPYVMKEYYMPVGNPIFFEGDIELIGKDSGYNLIEGKPFGFFEVEVKAPKNMKIPLLQIKLKTDNGFRTIAPVGTWTGTYFSEEIYNARNYGYEFKILRGYLFNKEKIFTNYVDFLYNIKVNSKKGTPDYIISKLLLNTLYGRFGMDPYMENHIIINNKDSLQFRANKIITNILDLNNGKELISFFDSATDACSELEKKSLNISIPIAAAVTAGARIHMTQFKTMDGITLFYTDTDSIDINKPLPSKFIGKELGKMKLEHIFNDAIFLAPKVYSGITDNYEYVRIKGLKNPIAYNELKPLLIKDQSICIEQEKWYRNISKGNIQIKQEIYTLINNNLKRRLIFDNNKFVDTAPICLNDNIIIDNN